MPRQIRDCAGGMVYNVMNRGAARLTIFGKDSDYDAFLRVMHEACGKTPMRICAYVLMPNHFHFVLWPHGDGDLSRFMGWLTMTHTQRWHAHYHTTGHGHLYQGRYKSFPIQADEHFRSVCRYVERNPLRANLVRRAEDWPWCSLRRRLETRAGDRLVSEWPADRPEDWIGIVNEPQTQEELDAVRASVRHCLPYGTRRWQQSLVAPAQGQGRRDQARRGQEP